MGIWLGVMLAYMVVAVVFAGIMGRGDCREKPRWAIVLSGVFWPWGLYYLGWGVGLGVTLVHVLWSTILVPVGNDLLHELLRWSPIPIAIWACWEWETAKRGALYEAEVPQALVPAFASFGSGLALGGKILHGTIGLAVGITLIYTAVNAFIEGRAGSGLLTTIGAPLLGWMAYMVAGILVIPFTAGGEALVERRMRKLATEAMRRDYGGPLAWSIEDLDGPDSDEGTPL
ncbi:MAG: hypothetical protein ACE5R4_15360 [Armatimonadota bacterium]